MFAGINSFLINDVSVKSIADNTEGNQSEITSFEEFLDILQQLCEEQLINNEDVMLKPEQEGNLLKTFVENTEHKNVIYENLVIMPEALNFDISQSTDVNLLLQNTEEQKESINIDESSIQETPHSTELNFPFYPIKPDNQKCVQDEVDIKQDSRILKKENDPQEENSLPFISKEIDTAISKQDDGFYRLIYDYRDNCYDVDYKHTHTNYFNQQRGVLTHRMNFSLGTLNSKLTHQVNFTISDAIHSNNKQIIAQLEPSELGKIEIIIDLCSNERNIIINADKISTYELLKKCSGELLDNIRSEDVESNISTNLTFNYKDSNQNNDKKQEFDIEERTEIYNNENISIANGLQPKKLSVLFIPIDVDRQLDILV